MSAYLPWVAEIGRAYAMAVFGISTVAKLRSPRNARDTVVDFLPVFKRAPHLGLALALTLEIAIFALLALRPRWGLLVAASALAGLWGLMASALLRHRHIRCACFGGEAHPIEWSDFARNVVATAFCLVSAAVFVDMARTALDMAVVVILAALAVVPTVYCARFNALR